MAKKSAAKSITVGSVLKFKGYSEKPDAPIFDPGDFLRVIALGDDSDSFMVARFAPTEKEENGYTGEQELVYLDEVSLAIEDEAEDAYNDDPDNELASSPFNEKTPAPSIKTKKNKTNDKSEPMKTLKVKKGTTPAAPNLKTPTKKEGKAAPKVKAPKAPKEVKPPVEIKEIKDTKTVVQALKGRTPLEAIHEIEQKTAMSRWTLGGILSKMKREKLFLRVGAGKSAKEYDDSTDGFAKFCDEQTGTGYRVAMQLVANYEHFAPLGVDEAKLAVIPWHKLKLLLHVVESKEDADEWLEKADDMTGEELKAEVKTARINAGKTVKARGVRTDGDSMTRISFKLFNDQNKKLQKALALAKKRCEGDNPSDSEALDYIITEWMSQFA